ncbi:hypothetical protein FOZ61_000874 [Perkinsus olseni]|uniref:Uncharacterized protein n=1 Tax=Perkinsus olseni TaxID=32597 RepID=A0A7J6KRY5_PEROL|nr:hypothetical protein FOZ61_000874 [Perkinsus olseni]KAF4650655.1 hypothetical protein FOL46_000846 [Perkinsus olseni]
MPIVVTLLFVVLLVSLGALGTKYSHYFEDGYGVTFEHDGTSHVVEARIRCYVQHKSPYTYQVSLPVEGGDGEDGCSRYYYLTDEGVKRLENAKEHVKEVCDLTLPEKAFHEMFFFTDFMVTNLGYSTSILMERSMQ